ncbi:MAG: 4'-phosphopantetheinyl transferase superfamily protein [Oscillospiraceae bacterium]|nr:4'-phosphopantetheinyl transferase superfamily protein [Oscillospiraceae bacterium]
MHRVYFLNTDFLEDDAVFRQQLSLLSPTRQQKVAQYRFRKDQNLSLGAGILIARGLRAHGLLEQEIRYGVYPNEKPYFPDYAHIHFSVSHSANQVMAVFSDCPVGCDIEKIAEHRPALAARFFSAQECEFLSSLPDMAARNAAFYRLWTLKESFAKTLGLGLRLAFGSFTISLTAPVTVTQAVSRSAYRFEEFTGIPGFRAACCMELPS